MSDNNTTEEKFNKANLDALEQALGIILKESKREKTREELEKQVSELEDDITRYIYEAADSQKQLRKMKDEYFLLVKVLAKFQKANRELEMEAMVLEDKIADLELIL